MTRDIELQKELDNLSEKERFERTSIEAFEKRETLVADLRNRFGVYITKNEFPYIGYKKHLVVRYDEKTNLKDVEKHIVETYLDFGFEKYESDKKSVQSRPHFHLLKK